MRATKEEANDLRLEIGKVGILLMRMVIAALCAIIVWMGTALARLIPYLLDLRLAPTP